MACHFLSDILIKQGGTSKQYRDMIKCPMGTLFYFLCPLHCRVLNNGQFLRAQVIAGIFKLFALNEGS